MRPTQKARPRSIWSPPRAISTWRRPDTLLPPSRWPCVALLLTLGSRKVLLQHGAHVDLKDSQGNTALAVAEEAGNMAMSRLLRTSHHGETPPATSPASQRGEPATQAAPGDAFRDHEAHQAVAECAASFAYVEADV